MSIHRTIKYAILISALFLVLGSQGYAQTAPKAVHSPVITRSYAIEKGRPTDVLKLYLEAEDPDQDMLRIAVVVEQAGLGRYAPDWVYLKPEYKRQLLGFLQWDLFGSNADSLPEWTNITIRVSVFDRAGNESNEVFFPFTFVSEVIHYPPPPAPFDQPSIPRLGRIMVYLYDPSRMGGGDNERETP